MIVYNITTKVTNNIASAWLQWIQEEHIPEIISTGCFTHATVLHLLETDDSEGPTYAVQYFAANRNDYDKYIETFAEELRQKSFKKWGNQFISFRSLMQIVK
jgi:Domain of unknown function (DUF4286)